MNKLLTTSLFLVLLYSCGKTDERLATSSEKNLSPNSIASKEDIVFGADYENNLIHTFQIDDNGKISKIDTNTPGVKGAPCTLSMSNDRKTLYVGKIAGDSPNLISLTVKDGGKKLEVFEETLSINPERHPNDRACISSIFESSDSGLVYSVSRDYGTNIFSKNNSNRLIKKDLISAHSSIKDVRPSPDNKYLAYQITDKAIFWPVDINKGLLDRSELSAFSFETEAYLFLDNDTVVSADPYSRVRIYDIDVEGREKNEVSQVSWGSSTTFYDIAKTNNTVLVIGKGASGSYLKSFRIEDREISLVDSLDIKEWPQSIEVSRNGKYAVVSTRGENKILSVKVSPNGELKKVSETTTESYLFDLLVL